MNKNRDEADFHIPAAFEHQILIGHDRARAQILAASSQNHIPQAWLIGGSKGIGKATMAWHFARILVETGEFKDFQLTEAKMRPYLQNASTNILEISPLIDDKGHQKSVITIEQIRELSTKLTLSAEPNQWRAVIIDPVDAMNQNAANALLKLLEEPPKHLVFFLISHNAGHVMPTIRSRCQLLNLNQLTADEMFEIAKELALPIEKNAIIASEGSWHSAFDFQFFSKYYQEFIDILIDRNQSAKRLRQLSESLALDSAVDKFSLALNMIAFVNKRILLIHFGLLEGNENETELAMRLSRQQANDLAAFNMEIFQKFHEARLINLDATITIYDTVLKIAQFY